MKLSGNNIIMAKRIVTKIGDVFCAEIEGQCKRFFQYFAIDSTQLNSSVIRVFKEHYPMDYIPDISEIITGEVEFYAHTVLRMGIADGIWYKVGKSLELGDYRDVFFRIDGDIDRVERSEKWYVWKIGEPFIYVGKLPEKYYEADDGSVMPYENLIARFKTGKYSYFFPAY